MSPIAVVGAGIVGASVAYHLATRGLPVTLIDRVPSSAAGVTGDSFAWIGGSGGDWPGGAEDLRGMVLADYRRLEGELPGVRVRWTGSLAWGDVSKLPGKGAGLGPGRRWVGRSEIAALEPNLPSPLSGPSTRGGPPRAAARTRRPADRGGTGCGTSSVR
ncbi:FAD-dependent oxidoreductase [Actinoallomurus spadix]|uniref:FAD-dependent oxidoreductase n=1 Tax=Actinoallomurus spadix TaxID=79912 RepID=UPI003873C07F